MGVVLGGFQSPGGRTWDSRRDGGLCVERSGCAESVSARKNLPAQKRFPAWARLPALWHSFGGV